MRGIVFALTLALVLTGWVAASAQLYAPETLERYFRLEWEVARARNGPRIE